MSNIPTRRGPVPANPPVSFRTHPHTTERATDGMTPEWYRRHDEQWGNGGPADHSTYLPLVGMADLGERPDVAGLLADGMAAALRRTEEAVSESLANSVVGFDQGHRAGFVEGLRFAVQAIVRHKQAMDEDPAEEFTVSILGDIEVELLEKADGVSR